jgi:AcrR family transcriptional regulator
MDPAPVELDRRERRRRATREEIRRAAIELVAERGLDKVTIDAIAERADIGYRTFFNYFSSKEEALVEPGEPRAERITAALAARPVEEAPLEALRAALLAEFADFDEGRTDFCARMSIVEANPSLMPFFAAQMVVTERAIVDAIARRTGLDVENDLYPHLLAAVAGTALRTSMTRWRAAGSTGSPQPLLAEAFDALARGLTPPV